jgi:hypothetical protein
MTRSNIELVKFLCMVGMLDFQVNMVVGHFGPRLVRKASI